MSWYELLKAESPFLFTARSLDRLLRRRHASICCAAACAFAACVALVAIVPSPYGAGDIVRLLGSELPTFVVMATIFAIGGFAAVRMWRKLWRRGRDRWEVLVFGFGVRGVGAGAGLLILAWCIWQFGQYDADSTAQVGSFALGFLVGIVVGAPIGLGFGYFWGISMAAIFGIKRSHGSVESEPPLVSD